jgi:S-adenosylmethionine:tRNA ribosyltransferase-isomerase
MRLNHFHFELPDQLIARQPTADRRGSRLLAMGIDGDIQHQNFADILGHINTGDLLVFNNTKVIPARIFGKKETGGSVEILLERIIFVPVSLPKLVLPYYLIWVFRRRCWVV